MPRRHPSIFTTRSCWYSGNDCRCTYCASSPIVIPCTYGTSISPTHPILFYGQIETPELDGATAVVFNYHPLDAADRATELGAPWTPATVEQALWAHVGGKAGVHEFTELRWITVQTGPRAYPF